MLVLAFTTCVVISAYRVPTPPDPSPSPAVTYSLTTPSPTRIMSDEHSIRIEWNAR